MADNKIDEQLKKLRMGYKMEHVIKYNDFEMPVRILTTDEEIKTESYVRKFLEKDELDEKSYEEKIRSTIMKSILFEAQTINGVPYVSHAFFDKLSSAELESLYRRYISIVHEVDPEFLEMDSEKVKEIIEGIKKKKLNPKKVGFTYLAMIGLSYLELIQLQGNELG